MRRRTPLVALITVTLALVWGGRSSTLAAAEVEQWVADLIGADAQARQNAADQLAELGVAAKPAVPALTQALGDANAELRWRAARALGAIGGGAADAVPALIAALDDPETSVPAQ